MSTSFPGKTFLDGKVTLLAGDCLELLAALPENSIDSCVCDPPYHLTSIVKRYGKTSIDAEGTNEQRARSRKDGYGRLCGGFMGRVWDGGDIAFQVDTWARVLRVLKPGAYILAFSSSRTFGRMSVAIEDAGFITHPLIGWIFAQGFPKAHRVHAEGWEGWRYGGQALKPALEPIYMGQKPFSEATGTANIQRWGVGALNIDGCRVHADDAPAARVRHGGGEPWEGTRFADGASPMPAGRWPANVMTDGSPQVVAAFPNSESRPAVVLNRRASIGFGGTKTSQEGLPGSIDDSGSAARFFWSSKAAADDRLGSKHPSIKPLDLIQELVRLVTPKNGVCLDCFAGTGTTGEAAWREGCRAVLIEREPEYLSDIGRRMELAAMPTKRAAVASSKNKLDRPEDLPLFASLEVADAKEAAE